MLHIRSHILIVQRTRELGAEDGSNIKMLQTLPKKYSQFGHRMEHRNGDPKVPTTPPHHNLLRVHIPERTIHPATLRTSSLLLQFYVFCSNTSYGLLDVAALFPSQHTHEFTQHSSSPNICGGPTGSDGCILTTL